MIREWFSRLFGKRAPKPYTHADFVRDFPVKPAQPCACGQKQFEASPRPGVWMSAIIDGEIQHGRDSCGKWRTG